MAASFPNSVKTFTTKTDNIDDVMAVDVNDLQDEVNAIEQWLVGTGATGATVPASPVAGQWFLHTPTGRKVLMLYDGSDWVPLRNIGTTVVYVDATDGTDDPDNGGSVSTGAYATFAYALGQLSIAGDAAVTINLSADSFVASSISGLQYPSITIVGSLSVTSEAITVDGGVATNGATRGTVTDTGSSYSAAWAELLLRCNSGDNNGLTRVIKDATTGALTLLESWSVYSAGGDYDVCDWGTTISGVQSVSSGQQNVNFTNINFSGTVTYQKLATGTLSKCKFSSTGNGVQYFNGASIEIFDCVIDNSGANGVLASLNGAMDFRGSLITGSMTNGLVINTNSIALIRFGSAVDGPTIGIKTDNGRISMSASAVGGYNSVENCTNGLICIAGSITGTSNNQYSGNTTDESPAGASDPAYID